ncbi:MAG: hypothetical protein IJC84_01390 [Clostridia bacterium]|nr:hypothetical protein [Clostridia bacterium]
MNRLTDKIRWSNLPLFLGIVAVLLSFLPILILGEDSAIPWHDQLDGEVLVYVINAKNLFQSSFDEFMGGMASTSLTPASYGTVLFYWLFEPFTAFVVNYVFVGLVAFLGMYLLMDRLVNNKWIACVIGLLFFYLPFYSVYGLSVMGQPLLFYACLSLWNNERPYKAFCLTALFAAFSSLVLVGYADVLLLSCFALVMQICKRPGARYAWVQLAILLGIYLLPNLSLLAQILVPSDVVSHKTEMAVESKPAIQAFKTMFKTGQYHAASLHEVFFGWCVVTCGVGFLTYHQRSKEEKHRLWGLGALLAVAAAIAAFYAFWSWNPIVTLRRSLGGVFTSFQVDRFYWLYPALWYIMLGLCVWFLLQFTRQLRLQKILAWSLTVLLLLNIGTTLRDSSVLYSNYEQMLDRDRQSSDPSWDSFYSTELFDEIEAYIGLPQEEYRVGSVALFPSVPLYNGFYCIDGYSNNYDVEYKHRFRAIIADELEKSASLKYYYDQWGNRCYLFSSEIGQNYYFTKDDSDVVLKDLSFSGEALKQMGCDYIFSGLEIQSPERSGLEFVEKFEHADSPYCIRLYRVL